MPAARSPPSKSPPPSPRPSCRSTTMGARRLAPGGITYPSVFGNAGMRHMAVVGAGFSGTATVSQLLRRHGGEALAVTLINRHPNLARGVAYGTHSPTHFLNLPAARMSLFPDDEEDFLRYARDADS